MFDQGNGVGGSHKIALWRDPIVGFSHQRLKSSYVKYIHRWEKTSLKEFKYVNNELINKDSHKRYILETRTRDQDLLQEKEMQKKQNGCLRGPYK